MGTQLGIFTTHPIQYFAPLWRRLAATPDFEVEVFYFSDHSVRGGLDSGFGINVKWDVPLLDGYPHQFLSRSADLSSPRSVAIPDVDAVFDKGRFNAVLVQGYTYAFQRQVVRAARARGVRTVLRGELSDVVPFGGRSAVKQTVRNAYLRWFYSYIDAFCYIGEEARLHLVRRGIPRERMFFSPYSVDTELFERQRSEFDRGEERARLGIEPDQFALLFSGKLIPRKAPLLLIDALRECPARDRITLLIVGDGELRERVKVMAHQVLGDRAKLLGFVNQADIGRYFVAADAFVLPAEFETWGLVVNEAMQFGLPVIVTDRVGCHRDLVLEGKTGYVFPSGNVKVLRAALEALSSPEKRQAMGEAARERVRDFSVCKSAEGIVKAVSAGQPIT